MLPTSATSAGNQGARNGMRVIRSWRAGNVYIPEIAEVIPKIQPLTYCGMSRETAIGAGLWILAGVAGLNLAASAGVRSETNLLKKQQSNAAQAKSVAADVVVKSETNHSDTNLVQKQQSNAAQAESVAAVVETGTTDTGAALPQDMPKKDVMMSRVTCASGNMRVTKALIRAIFVDF